MEQEHEIPEAKDPYERNVALTVAILAVVLSIVASLGDNARLQALLESNQAADQWAYYQSKSIKKDVTDIFVMSLPITTVVDEAKRAEVLEELKKNLSKYEGDKEKIKEDAEKHDEKVKHYGHMIHYYEEAELLLHVAIVLGSVAILIRMVPMWIVCMVLGAAGAVMAALPTIGFHV